MVSLVKGRIFCWVIIFVLIRGIENTTYKLLLCNHFQLLGEKGNLTEGGTRSPVVNCMPRVVASFFVFC